MSADGVRPATDSFLDAVGGAPVEAAVDATVAMLLSLIHI